LQGILRTAAGESALDRHESNSEQLGGTGPASGSTIFRTGHNCWAVTQADRVSVRIDSADYFRAFMVAALNARESLFILGWDFHSRAQLLCEGETLHEDPQAPRLLGDFLNYVAERRRGLRIRILIWDFPSIFGVEREFPFFYGTPVPGAWRPHRRIQIRFDSSHRFGGSHHQKIVVADDLVAFCGGIDLTRARWDTCAHAASNSHRLHDGQPYSPVHDMMMQVEGDTARALGVLARRRWRRSGGAPLIPGPRSVRHAMARRRRARFAPRSR
jgi:phospholipase D1/2